MTLFAVLEFPNLRVVTLIFNATISEDSKLKRLKYFLSAFIALHVPPDVTGLTLP